MTHREGHCLACSFASSGVSFGGHSYAPTLKASEEVFYSLRQIRSRKRDQEELAHEKDVVEDLCSGVDTVCSCF